MNDTGALTRGLAGRLGAQKVNPCERGDRPDHDRCRAESQIVKETAGSGTDFGRQLAGFRFSRGLSQEELADRSGMSVRAIRDLERGKVAHPRRTSVALLANALALAGTDREVFKDAANVPELSRFRIETRQITERIMPCQLPPDILDFTGRELALDRVHSLAQDHDCGSTAMMIAAVTGKAGVGKTTLAVHAAHQLRSLFTDGQLYVDLGGAGSKALDPSHVLGRFLRAFAVGERSIPADVDERAGLYRSLMADRRVLVLLDNAADGAQVRPLLPGGAGNIVLVTSRTQLAGLAVAELIHLDVLPAEQAVKLIAKLAGEERIAGEPDTAEVIAALCGYLPQALRIAGGRLAVEPHWRLRCLACMPAALFDTPVHGAEEIADRLADAPLLDTVHYVARQLHDLLCLYFRERLAAAEAPAAQRAALPAAWPGANPDPDMGEIERCVRCANETMP
jgi:transcriptional regulator with XRE-family HTH domain